MSAQPQDFETGLPQNLSQRRRRVSIQVRQFEGLVSVQVGHLDQNPSIRGNPAPAQMDQIRQRIREMLQHVRHRNQIEGCFILPFQRLEIRVHT